MPKDPNEDPYSDQDLSFLDEIVPIEHPGGFRRVLSNWTTPQRLRETEIVRAALISSVAEYESRLAAPFFDERCQKDRRLLLLLSSLGWIYGVLGVRPESIEALAMPLPSGALEIVLVVGILYEFVMFRSLGSRQRSKWAADLEVARKAFEDAKDRLFGAEQAETRLSRQVANLVGGTPDDGSPLSGLSEDVGASLRSEIVEGTSLLTRPAAVGFLEWWLPQLFALSTIVVLALHWWDVIGPILPPTP